MARKPKNAKPMTSAERVRLHRMKKKAEGETQITMNFSAATLKIIDELVEFFELSNRAEVMQQLLQRPLVEAIEAMKAAKSVPNYNLIEGATNEADREVIKRTKSILWKSICLNEPLLGEALHYAVQQNLGGSDDR